MDLPLTADELSLVDYLNSSADTGRVVKRIEERLTVPSFAKDTIYLQSYIAAGESQSMKKPHVLFVHGLGDYGGRQAWKARYLIEHGFDCTLYDHVGHGRSSGVRGLVPSVQQLIGTLDHIINHISQKFKCQRIVLVGESMGGLACLLHAIEYQQCQKVAAMFLVAPFIRGHGDSMPNAVLRFMAGTLAYWAPWLPVASANKGNNHSDPKVEQVFNSDIGTYSGLLRIGTGNMFLEALDIVQQNAASCDFTRRTVMIAHGDEDRVADIEGSLWLAKLISPATPENILWTIPKGQHVLYADFRSDILQRLVKFCDGL